MSSHLYLLVGYIDPVLGSMVIQGVIAVLATIGYVFRKYLGMGLRAILRLGRKPSEQSTPVEDIPERPQQG